MDRAGKAVIRLAQLSAHLVSARQSDRNRYGRFFATVNARLNSARAVDRELDQMLARRFNALDYLRTDELGLSKIVADLLDPSGAHGQGPAFLDRFIELIDSPPPWLTDSGVPLNDSVVSVARERATDGGGRLDISVEFRLPGQDPACIAIENKPYAADGEAQIEDYLAFLRHRYGERFLLVYLSRHGGRPSSVSLPDGASEDGLKTMSYCLPVSNGASEAPGLRLPFSLTDWLGECRRSCDADRLRWFLSETASFCHKTFGGTVTTTSEQKAMKDFILASNENVLATITLVEAWPETRNDVVRRFLRSLRERVTDQLCTIEDLQIESGFASRGRNGVWVFKTAWSTGGAMPPLVMLSPEGSANNWYVGVKIESDSSDSDVGEHLRQRLRRAMPSGKESSAGWPWYRYLEEHRDWAPLVAQLHRETGKTGELMNYFSHCLVEVVEKAVPVIDEVVAADC